MTLKQFTDLYNERRRQTMEQGYYPVTFKTTKRKTVRKAVTEDRLTASGVPERVTISPKQTKEVVDTNGLTKLYQAMWEYFTGTKLKRISSEGKWRAGVGFIPSTNKGFADLHGLYQGRGIYIEVKQKYEAYQPSQLKFIQWVREGGGQYFTVRSFTDMIAVVKEVTGKQIV